jgi:hypothetical protein
MVAKETPARRKFLIRKKQKRRKKIKKLKGKYLKAKTKEEKEKIIEKILRIAPHYPIENVLKLEETQKSNESQK